jgi:hypothetical protein
MKKNKKWLFSSFISIILIVVSISILNYKIDSLGLFGNTNYLVKAAQALTDGKMIAGLKNSDERFFQELIIKNLKVKNDAIAIGSSRTMQLRKRFFLEDKINFFNHSVSGASLEDYIAIVGAYEMIHGYIPKTIVLGTDPWIFNKYSGQNRWKSLQKYYDFEISKFSDEAKINATVNTTKWKQLINYDYTISNIKFVKTLIKNNGKIFYITDTIEIDDGIKEIDGSIHYPYKRRFIKSDAIKRDATSYTKGKVYSLEKYDKLSNLKLFENFIKYLQSKNIKIIFFLPPYNPITYDILMKKSKYHIINRAEKYLINFANKNDIEIKGSYNPHKYNFKYTDFSDGMHGKNKVAKKIFE